MQLECVKMLQEGVKMLSKNLQHCLKFLEMLIAQIYHNSNFLYLHMRRKFKGNINSLKNVEATNFYTTFLPFLIVIQSLC